MLFSTKFFFKRILFFQVDISPENDVYNEIRTKIASFQSDNQLKDFILQYTDEENERITFSSNDELRSAIALNKDSNTLKVFVTFSQPIPQQQQQQQQQQQREQEDTTNKECHVGVECDGCKGPIIGCRYKCFVCPNYDLCEKCSSAGIHSEHNMIKITKPGNFQPLNGHLHHHFHAHRRHHAPPTPTPPPFVPNPALLEQIQSQIPQWLPNRENTAHFRAHMQQHLDSLKNNTQTHVQNSKQYLESVGQYLQKALSPYGINCDYHVDEKNPTANQQQEEQVPTVNQQEEEQVSTTDTVPTPEPSAVPKYPDLAQANNNEEQAASASTPLLEASTKITNPLEKAVDDCLERMKGMGFNDGNGALRELVRSKNGDINSVLDAINPRNHQA
jgi:hypothetical protein